MKNHPFNGFYGRKENEVKYMLIKEGGEKIMARNVTRGNAGRGSKGACGGTRKRDGSGGGKGNRGTKNQPKGGRK